MRWFFQTIRQSNILQKFLCIRLNINTSIVVNAIKILCKISRLEGLNYHHASITSLNRNTDLLQLFLFILITSILHNTATETWNSGERQTTNNCFFSKIFKISLLFQAKLQFLLEEKPSCYDFIVQGYWKNKNKKSNITHCCLAVLLNEDSATGENGSMSSASTH